MLVKVDSFVALRRAQLLATYIPFAMVSGCEIFEGLEMANPNARKGRDRRVLALILVNLGFYRKPKFFCL